MALLINPPIPAFGTNKEFSLPPSLLYLAGYAKRFGFQTAILDMNLYLRDGENVKTDTAFYLDMVYRNIEALLPSVVGVGCLFSGQFPFVNNVTSLIKKKWPEIITCTGGIHPTLFAKEILMNCLCIDFVCIGESERQFVEILRYSENRIHDLNIDGVGFRKNGQTIIRKKKSYLDDLDQLPLPAYDLIDFDDYRRDLSKWHNPKNHFFDISVPIISSRSCPNRCNFCSMFLVMGPRFRARSAAKVVDEIEHLYNIYQVKHFSFMDDNLTFSRHRTLQICDEIIRRGLDIQFDTPNGLMVRTLEEEIVDALASAGWIRGSIAIESGSDYIRNQVIGKSLSRDKIFEVLGYIEKHPQIYLRAYFIMGFPEETIQTLNDSYAMIEQLDIDEVYVNNLLPFPGTRLFDQCVHDNLLIGFNEDSIWRADCLYFTGNKQFFIKPYAMDVSELVDYRKKFDFLLAQKRKCARDRRMGHNSKTLMCT